MDRAGVSYYLGFPGDKTPSYENVELAADIGVRLFFTSVQIPEADIEGSIPEFRRIGEMAKRRGLRIITDVSPKAFERLGGSVSDLSPFADLGFSVLRIDAGFSPEVIAKLAQNPYGLEIMINASPISEESAQRYEAAGLSLQEHLAGHNYYPRVESGMSLRWAEETATILHRHGALVQAFVASQSSRRPYTYEGLCTLERQRWMSVGRAAMELFARHVADVVFIGDPATNEAEIRELLEVAEAPHLRLRVAVQPQAGPEERQVAFSGRHSTLNQDFEFTYRARGDRQRETLNSIPPRAPLPRPVGTVTVDNVMYPRYAGELQIARIDLPAEPRTNVVGRVVDEDRPLLELLRPRTVFELIPA